MRFGVWASPTGAFRAGPRRRRPFGRRVEGAGGHGRPQASLWHAWRVAEALGRSMLEAKQLIVDYLA